MTLQQVCQILNDSGFGTALRESTLMFPLLETFHILAIALLVGTVAVVDLRLLGVVFRRTPVSHVASQILPLTWMGFFVTSISGIALFIAEAEKMYANPAFRWKVALLLLVGLNPVVFHFTIYKKVSEWDTRVFTPIQARTAGILSLLLWSGVIIAGRVIAYY